VCEAPPLTERYDVVTCDPTQASKSSCRQQVVRR
jgi:hypothetical protein